VLKRRKNVFKIVLEKNGLKQIKLNEKLKSVNESLILQLEVPKFGWELDGSYFFHGEGK
jgi:hypothetical protein